MDSPHWANPSGVDCTAYALEGHCADGKIVPGHEWAGGSKFGHPEINCCVCGMPSRQKPPSPMPCLHGVEQTFSKAYWLNVCSKTYCSKAYMESLLRKAQQESPC